MNPTPREKWEDKLGYSCSGPHCPHEIIDNHWVLTEKEICRVVKEAKKEEANRIVDWLRKQVVPFAGVYRLDYKTLNQARNLPQGEATE